MPRKVLNEDEKQAALDMEHAWTYCQWVDNSSTIVVIVQEAAAAGLAAHPAAIQMLLLLHWTVLNDFQPRLES